MKISKETLEILRHYSSINPGIIFDGNEENKIYTKNMTKTCRSMCVIKESIPVSAIGNLSQFLNTVSFFEDPDFFFEEDRVRIKSEDGSMSVVYYLSDPALVANEIKTISQEKIDNSMVYSFDISAKDLQILNKACGTLGLDDIKIYSSDGKLFIMAYEKKKGINTSSKYEICVGDYTGEKDVEAYIKKQSLLLNYNYGYNFVLTSMNLLEATALNSPYDELKFYCIYDMNAEY